MDKIKKSRVNDTGNSRPSVTIAMGRALSLQACFARSVVEKYRFKGTCDQAANWVYVGKTKGRGKLGPAGKQSVPIKDLWLYPLTRDFRSVLTQ